ncbi:MAG TPA: hypothetical protein VEH04_17030 [Verrucomicrobiae bacterium]|nr:hypothetical protein [Verrucomicrobiae bacterium]
MTYAEEKQHALNLIKSVAAQFPGSELVVDDEGHVRYLSLGGDEGLYIGYDRHKNRLNISGRYLSSRIEHDNEQFYPGRLWNPKCETPSITVDANKSPEQIKKDIERRFLPDYRAALARCREARDAHEAYINETNATAAALAAKLNSVATGNAHGTHLKRHIRLDHLDGSVDVSRDSASFSLSLSLDKARKLAAFLATL